MRFPKIKPHTHPLRTADLLLKMVEDNGTPTVTIGDLMQGLGDRSFGLLLLIFSLPNCIPMLPGVASLLGLPPLFFGFQLMMGQHRPWLPAKIRNYTLNKADIRRVIDKATPTLRRFEKICKPRLEFITSGLALRILGTLIFVLSSFILSPIPGANMLPAYATAIMAIGLIERDGLVVLISMVTSFLFMYLSAVLAIKGVHMIHHMIMGWFA